MGNSECVLRFQSRLPLWDPKVRRHDDVVRHEGSAPLLTGQHAATNPRIQEEALQAALVRLLQEAQPRLDKVAMVRR